MKKYLIIGVVVFLAGLASLVLFSASFQFWLLERWELSTGRYTIVEEKQVSESQQIRESITEISDRKAKLAEELEALRREREVYTARLSVFIEAWTETARGYLSVTTEACPPTEACQSVERADLVVVGTPSDRLTEYLGGEGNSPMRVPIGCLDEERIRTLPMENLATRDYQYIEDDVFLGLQSSSADELITLSFTKPYYPEYGTEEVSCMTPFVDFHVVDDIP